MHHKGANETHVILKDSEQLAQKKIAKYNSFTIPAGKSREAKVTPSKFVSVERDLAVSYGLIWSRKYSVKF